MLLVLLPGLLWASSSTSYKITVETMDAGTTLSTSATYRVLGKMRERQMGVSSGSSFMVGSGFLKSVYFGVKPVVFAPIVTVLTPNSGVNTGPISITDLAGANFISGAVVKLTKSGQPDISATGVVVENSGKITCTFDITGAAAGLWDATVTNPDGRSGNLPSAFTVTYTAPTVAAITPVKGTNDGSTTVAIAGSNFRAGAAVKLSKTGENDIIADNIVVESAAKITALFNLVGKTVGLWDLTIVNDDNQSASLREAFKIEAPTIAVIGEVVSTQNPFNPATGTTSITYTLSKDADIRLYVHNIRGERVYSRVFPAGAAGGQAGVNEIVWDGITDLQSMVSFGVYFVYVTTIENGAPKILRSTKIAIIK